MIYNLVNMSDPYTFKADTLEVAALVCTVLGGGQYGVRSVDDELVVPICFGGIDEWFTNNFGHGVQKSADLHTEEDNLRYNLITAFRSVVIGRLHEREEFDISYSSVSNPEEWRAKRHDDRRTSMNDIGGRALQIADVFEKNEGSIPKAPQQVFF